jgi:DNA-binding CsgD family transcriptional regulator
MLQALTSRDLRAALDTLHTIGEASASVDGFARQGVASLKCLVAAELTTLSICNLDSGRRSVISDVPGAIARREIDAFDRHFHEHPLVCDHGRNPRAETRRISDLVPAAEFQRSALFNDYYRPIRIDHAMAAPIHVDRTHLVSFVFNRAKRDFADRDRACLEAIRPHLGSLYRLSREMDSARAAWGVPPAVQNPPGGEALTDREREVLQWLSSGKTDRDIAQILAISPRTVHKHLQRIYEKLGVETRTAAVMRALSVPA